MADVWQLPSLSRQLQGRGRVRMSSDHVKIAFSGNRGVSQGRGNAGSVSVRIFTSAPVLSLLQPRTGANPAFMKHFKPGHVLLCDFCLFKMAMIGTSSTILLHHGEFLPPLHLSWLPAEFYELPLPRLTQLRAASLVGAELFFSKPQHN